MKRALLWLLAASLLLAAAWWLFDPPGSPARERVEAIVGPSADTVSGPLPVPVATTDLPVSAISGIQILLLPNGPVAARTDSVRIGLARVPEEEMLAFRQRQAEGGEGAGPENLSELAQLETWLPLPALRLADGRVQLGPFDLPAADRFELQASGEDPLHFYRATFTAADVPAEVRPIIAGGLRLRREPATDSLVQVLLRRVEERADAAVWQELMAVEAPQLLAAYSETALPIATEQVLAPLPPGPLELILEVDGIEAERRTVELIAGATTELVFDPLKQQVARAVALELEFVLAGFGRAIPELQVSWSNPRGEQLAISDTQGRVRFKGVDRQRSHDFLLTFPPAQSDLPTWPSQKILTLALAEETVPAEARSFRKTISLAPLRWLRIGTGSFAVPGDRQRGNPYPIFMLQTEHETGWADAASEHFIPVPEGLAVSIEADGRYRLAALATPWSVRYSGAADTRLASADGQYPVSLQSMPGRVVEVTVMREGVPVTNTPIALRGSMRGLPPLNVKTDARGRLQLTGVTMPSVQIEVPGHAVVEADLRLDAVVVELLEE